jgi:hypothetical protein
MWSSPRTVPLAALLAVLLTLPSLSLGLIQDDLSLYMVATGRSPEEMLGERAPWDLFRFYGDPETVQRMREQGFAPWWTSDELRLAFFRPLSSLWHQLDFELFGLTAWPQHLGSVLAYGASVLAVGFALRRLEPSEPGPAAKSAAPRATEAARTVDLRQRVASEGGKHEPSEPGPAAKSAAPRATEAARTVDLRQRVASEGGGHASEGGTHEPDPSVAGLATVLWAIDDAHGMPVGWLANRNAVLAWGLGALALALHDRWRRDGWGPGVVLAPLVAALALGAGETALGAWAYLLAYALLIERGPWLARAASVLPYGLVFLAWRAIYALGGYGTGGSSFYVDPGDDAGAFLAVLPERLVTLLAAQLGPLPADLLLILPAAGRPIFLGLALATLLAAGAALAPILRRDERARFWALGMALACVPMAATWPSERLLGFVGLGAFALIARVLLDVGMAAVLLPLRSIAVAVPDAQQRAAADSLPEMEGRELVVVVAPDWFVPAFGSVHYFLRGGAPGRGLRILATTRGPFEATRLDEHTLELTSPAGFLDDPLAAVVRDAPLRPGEQLTVGSWDISVLETDGEGHPTRLRFRSPTPLDDPERIWTTWDGKELVPFTLP